MCIFCCEGKKLLDFGLKSPSIELQTVSACLELMRKNILLWKASILDDEAPQIQYPLSRIRDVCLSHIRYDWMVEASKTYKDVLAESVKNPRSKIYSRIYDRPDTSCWKQILDEEYVSAVYAYSLRPELRNDVENFHRSYGPLQNILLQELGVPAGSVQTGSLEDCSVDSLRKWLEFVHGNKLAEYGDIEGLLEIAYYITKSENHPRLLMRPHLIDLGMGVMKREESKPISLSFPFQHKDDGSQDYMALRAWILWSHRQAIKEHNLQAV